MFVFISKSALSVAFLTLLKKQKESGTEIGHSLEMDFVVPPPHSFNSLGDC